MTRSKLAVWSFVLVLVAYLLVLVELRFFLSPLFPILYIADFIGVATLIMSIISLVEINKKKLSGRGLAKATIILSLILFYLIYIIPRFSLM